MLDKIISAIEKGNNVLNGIVWGWPMIIMILGTGILLTVLTRFLQVRKFKDSLNSTIVPTLKSLGKKKSASDGKSKTISQFEAFSAAISGTVGTGNIIGVTSAIMTGGPGAVFWMWLSAFFGMVTNYSENVLGLYFRKRDKEGNFSGGAMYYLSEGLKWKTLGKVMGCVAAVFCAVAAIGMSGAQTNKISTTLQATFTKTGESRTVALISGIVVAILLALIIIGGIKRIGKVASILVPFMSLFFIIMSLIIIAMNITNIGSAFAKIFTNIFSFSAAVGGFGGYAFSQIIQKGLARGVFSNEAGLGSSVIAHSASETKEPVKQGLWGVFEVFFDTFIICTLTALVILVSFDDAFLFANIGGKLSNTDTAVAMQAFSDAFGMFGKVSFSIILPLFAFTTIVAWSYYGEKAVEFLFRRFGDKVGKISVLTFKILYVLLVIFSAVINGELAWAISDTSNGLMALPNLFALICLSGLVWKITKNYYDRKKGIDVEPMLSADPALNEEFKQKIAEEN